MGLCWAGARLSRDRCSMNGVRRTSLRGIAAGLNATHPARRDGKWSACRSVAY
jgi:hypothetical protein